MIEEGDHAPGTEWEPPGGCWIFLGLDRGHGYWLGPGEALEVSPGTLLVLPPSRAGVLRISQLSSLHCQWFRFCPEMMGGVLSMTELHLFKKQRPLVRLLPATHPAARAFQVLASSGPSQNGFFTRGRMLELIGHVFGCDVVRNPAIEGPVLSASKRIKLLMSQLTEEEFIRASLDELAGWCGCSVRHFSRLFRGEFGVSLRVRQTESRLLKAGRLLVEGDARIVKVAGECGYRHLGVFNALFKERFGVTPSEWRRRHQGGPSESSTNGNSKGEPNGVGLQWAG